MNDANETTVTHAPHASLIPPPQLRSIVTAWLQDDIPSHFDVGGYVVGNAAHRAELWSECVRVLILTVAFEPQL